MGATGIGQAGATQAGVPVVATPVAVPVVASADDVEELFRQKAYALLGDPAVLAAIRADLVGKSGVARQKMLLGLLTALKREGPKAGSGSLNVIFAHLPRPE